MKLRFKERMFSWFDSYEIYDESGSPVYQVKGRFSWGHCLKIYDMAGRELGMVKERIFTLLPKFELYEGDVCIGTIEKQFSLIKQNYDIDCNGWHVEGSFTGWDYVIYSTDEEIVASISKEIFQWTDTYTLDIRDPRDALYVVMLVLAVDAEKCTQNAGA